MWMLPVLALVFLAMGPEGLDRYQAKAYAFGISYPVGWKVEERTLAEGAHKMGEVSFMPQGTRGDQLDFFKVVASQRDSTSSAFKGIVEMAGNQAPTRELIVDETPIKALIDEGETTWVLCDRVYPDYSYRFTFRVQGPLDKDAWNGIQMVMRSFARH